MMTNPLRQRVLQMTLAWAFIGQWVGADIGMRAGGLIGSIAGSVAVMVEMAVLGAFLGWIGGSPRDTIIGAALGLIAGVMLAPLSGQVDLISRGNIGLIAGASDGAMLRPYLRLIGRLLCAATRRLGWTLAGASSPGCGPYLETFCRRNYREIIQRHLRFPGFDGGLVPGVEIRSPKGRVGQVPPSVLRSHKDLRQIVGCAQVDKISD
jgi:hypothetical protein